MSQDANLPASSDECFASLKDTLHFEPLKAHRGKYLVEYNVPIEGYSFAMLSIVLLESMEAEDIAKTMEAELALWARRFPVPIMVSAFKDTDDLIHLEPARAESHLIGWIDSAQKVHAHWRILKNEEVPSAPFTKSGLLAAYGEVPHRWNTAEQKRATFKARILQNRVLAAIVVVWLILIPVTIAIVGMANFWVGLATTVLSMLQGLWKLAELMGWKKKSERQLKKEAEELKMRHHDYWCRKNPAGFARLMGDAIDREASAAVHKEAAAIKNNARPTRRGGPSGTNG